MDRLWTKAGYGNIDSENVRPIAQMAKNLRTNMRQSLDMDRLWTRAGFENVSPID